MASSSSSLRRDSSSTAAASSSSSVPFFHAPAPAVPLDSSDEEEEEDEGAAAAWAARCCEAGPSVTTAADEEAEAEWLARTATAAAAARPSGGATAAAAGESWRQQKHRPHRESQEEEKKRRRTDEEEEEEEEGETEQRRQQQGFGENGTEEEEEGLLYIHNVMAYAQLNCSVNLDAACQAFGNAVYMPGVFESVRVDLRCKTYCVASINIFSNGKLTGTGANSVAELHYAMKKVGRRLQRHPLTRCPVSFSHFHVKNILGSFSFSSLLSLHALAAQRGLAADYEPERFPAVKVRVPVPPQVLLQQQQQQQQQQQHSATQQTEERQEDGRDRKEEAAHSRRVCSAQGVWSQQLRHTQGQQQHEQTLLSWNSSSNKEEVVTLHLFSTGNVTLFGGRSVESLQYALHCVLPFMYKCRVRPQ